MKRDDISDAFNSLDNDIIEETNKVRQNPKGRSSFFRRYHTLAACLTFTLVLGCVMGIAWMDSSPTESSSSDGGSGNDIGNESFGLAGDLASDTPTDESLEFAIPEVLASNENFHSSQMNFALTLFQHSASKSQYDNVLISPLSMMHALSMTANGASRETKDEMLAVLANSLTQEELNEALCAYTEHLSSTGNLQLANSIWIREDENLSINEDFLDINQTYFDARIFTEPFHDQTADAINKWITTNTNNRITKIVDNIDSDTVMYLINALTFDAEWEDVYTTDNIVYGSFYSSTGNSTGQKTEMMHSTEHFYLSSENAVGFIKNYKDGTYRFAALLPNEGISLSNYIESLTTESITDMLQNAEKTSVTVAIPKFSYEYKLDMNSVLKEMGINKGFDSTQADFSNLGTFQNGNLYLGKVLHKTFIAVDEKGTAAGAVTSVDIKAECALETSKEVILNRPFVYMILDGETNLPVFIGTLTQIPK